VVSARTAERDARARAIAVLFARLVLGLIFFMAGVYKVFELTPAAIRRLA
jgi:uncharacterized membrane protein YphA (DoxX/SURF4 family)